jgi:short-subunit dehydrogenase
MSNTTRWPWWNTSFERAGTADLPADHVDARDDGHIVSTASVAGLISGPLQIPYNVSKYGVVALSEGLRRELALIESKIKVSVLCPGFVHARIMESERSARTYDTATG